MRSSRGTSASWLAARIFCATASGAPLISATLPTTRRASRVVSSRRSICGAIACRSSVTMRSVWLSSTLCSSTFSASSGE